MNPDPESLLNQLTPRGAGAELRSRVLARMGQELTTRSRRRWEWWCTRGVAASLLLGTILNFWISRRHQERLAELYGPPAVPVAVLEVAQAVESVTDAPTARLVEQRLLTTYRSEISLPDHVEWIEIYLRDLETVSNGDRR